jgi:hypothetical protein
MIVLKSPDLHVRTIPRSRHNPLPHSRKQPLLQKSIFTDFSSNPDMSALGFVSRPAFSTSSFASILKDSLLSFPSGEIKRVAQFN